MSSTVVCAVHRGQQHSQQHACGKLRFVTNRVKIDVATQVRAQSQLAKWEEYCEIVRYHQGSVPKESQSPRSTYGNYGWGQWRLRSCSGWKADENQPIRRRIIVWNMQCDLFLHRIYYPIEIWPILMLLCNPWWQITKSKTSNRKAGLLIDIGEKKEKKKNINSSTVHG